MKPRLVAIFVLIVVLPLAILAWFGIRIARTEQEVLSHRFRDVLTSRLDDVAADAAGLIEQRERDIMAAAPPPTSAPDALREATRQSSIVRQYFMLDANGILLFPSFPGQLSEDEKEFLERTRQVWLNGDVPGPSPESQNTATVFQGKPAAVAGSTDGGWHAWYWSNGIDLIFWWRDQSGVIVGAELNVARFMADLIGLLPQTNPTADASPSACIALLDSNGSTIYQWGVYRCGKDEAPLASLPLQPPLAAWKLVYYGPDAGAGQGGRATFSLLSGLAAFAVALIGLAAYYYRENSRDMREAAQRVSFVNQVSHELRTPLTNIRMYAELLEGELDEADEKAHARLRVIVAESRRLSRLIGNVLTFSRKQRSALRLHAEQGNVDETVLSVLEQFEPSLTAKGLSVAFQAGAPNSVLFDRDAIEQVLGNLLSNVEKYAGSGSRVDVATSQKEDDVSIVVTDDGPGIPPREAERVFEPFYRVSNRLTDGVAGTGMGLAIARDLARLHGGDLEIAPVTTGASFRFTFKASRATPGGSQ